MLVSLLAISLRVLAPAPTGPTTEDVFLPTSPTGVPVQDLLGARVEHARLLEPLTRHHAGPEAFLRATAQRRSAAAFLGRRAPTWLPTAHTLTSVDVFLPTNDGEVTPEVFLATRVVAGSDLDLRFMTTRTPTAEIEFLP